MASAPYRFVPYSGAHVIKAEFEAKKAINTAKMAGLCAEIDLEWEAESPLLIGSQSAGTAPGPASVVTPLKFGVKAEDYFIPGATLRGAIRSVAEIAAGAWLSQVNRGRVFPLRDFNHAAYRQIQETRAGKMRFPVSNAGEVKAGWLRFKDPQSPPALSDSKNKTADKTINDAFLIEPCDWYAIEVADMGVGDVLKFVKQDAASKYGRFGCSEGAYANPTKKSASFVKQPSNYSIKYCHPNREGFRGYYVFSGKAPPPPKNNPEKHKKVEYVFTSPSEQAAFPVPEITMQQFRELNSVAVDDELRLDDNTWKQAVAAFRNNPEMRWPVFYVGTPGGNAFFFGLTRLFKVPHAWDFAAVLRNSGVGKPLKAEGAVDPGNLDMVDTLFGYVHEPSPSQGGDKRPPSENARKGRIAFSPARIIRGNAPPTTETMDTIMGAPRPSFAPFYLKADQDGYRDYSGRLPPVIAGRKRYLAQIPPGNPQNALKRVKDNLKKQLDNNPDAGRDIKSSLTFLVPRAMAPLKFTSKIRLFNVTKAELGMVLWALTFGGANQCRHMLGRAKPFGAGQMKLTISKLRVHANDSVEEEEAPKNEIYLKAFNDYIARMPEEQQEKLHQYRSTLITLSDPAKGDALHRVGALDTMLLSQFQKTRNNYKPSTDNAAPARSNPLTLTP